MHNGGNHRLLTVCVPRPCAQPQPSSSPASTVHAPPSRSSTVYSSPVSYVSTIVCDQDGPPRDEDGDIGHSELEYMYSALLVQRFDARATLERSQMESSGTDDRSQRRAARNHMRTMLSDERRQLELSHYRVRGETVRTDRSHAVPGALGQCSAETYARSTRQSCRLLRAYIALAPCRPHEPSFSPIALSGPVASPLFRCLRSPRHPFRPQWGDSACPV